MAVSASPGARRRLKKRMSVETPNASIGDADLFDFWEFPHPDSRGISETPAQAEAAGGRASCAQLLDAPHAPVVRRDAGECSEGIARECQRECGRMLIDNPAAAFIIGPVSWLCLGERPTAGAM